MAVYESHELTPAAPPHEDGTLRDKEDSDEENWTLDIAGKYLLERGDRSVPSFTHLPGIVPSDPEHVFDLNGESDNESHVGTPVLGGVTVVESAPIKTFSEGEGSQKVSFLEARESSFQKVSPFILNGVTRERANAISIVDKETTAQGIMRLMGEANAAAQRLLREFMLLCGTYPDIGIDGASYSDLSTNDLARRVVNVNLRIADVKKYRSPVGLQIIDDSVQESVIHENSVLPKYPEEDLTAFLSVSNEYLRMRVRGDVFRERLLTMIPGPVQDAANVLGIVSWSNTSEVERGYISALQRLVAAEKDGGRTLQEEGAFSEEERARLHELSTARLRMLRFLDPALEPAKDTHKKENVVSGIPLKGSLSEFSSSQKDVVALDSHESVRDFVTGDNALLRPGVAATRLGLGSSAAKSEVIKAYDSKLADLYKDTRGAHFSQEQYTIFEERLKKLNAARISLLRHIDLREESARILNISLPENAAEVHTAHQHAFLLAMSAQDGERIQEINRARDILLTYIVAKKRAEERASVKNNLPVPASLVLPPAPVVVPLLPAVQKKPGFFARFGDAVANAVAAPGRVIRGAVLAVGIALGIVGEVTDENQNKEWRERVVAEAAEREMRADVGVDGENDDDLGGFARGDMDDSGTIDASDFRMGDEEKGEENREARTYTAKRGDTGEGIVQDMLVSAGLKPNHTRVNFLAHALLESNGFATGSDGSDLQIGQRLNMETVWGHIDAMKDEQQKDVVAIERAEKGKTMVSSEGAGSEGVEDVSALSAQLVVTPGESAENNVGSSVEASGIAYFRPNQATGKKYEDIPTAKNPEHVMRKGEIIYAIIRKMMNAQGLNAMTDKVGYISELVLRANADRFKELIAQKKMKTGPNGEIREGLIPADEAKINFTVANEVIAEIVAAKVPQKGKKTKAWSVYDSAKRRGLEWPVVGKMAK